MSIPAAVGRRLNAGEPLPSVLLHSLFRFGSLLLIGVFMVNSPDSSRMNWPDGLWRLLLYLGVFMVWHFVPAKSRPVQVFSLAFRIAGAVLLAFLALEFQDAKGSWLQIKWWGILGLIGWAYLVALVVYFAVRESRAALSGAIALLMCVYIAFREGLLTSPWVGGGVIGSQPAIAVAGVFLGTLVFPDCLPSPARFRSALALIGCSAAGAWLLRPLYGIGKNAATPSWCLWSIAITGSAWLVLHWIIDLKGREHHWRLFQYLGNNALFAYILAALAYSAFQTAGIHYSAIGRIGLLFGLARSFAFSLAISALAAWALRKKFRLKL